MKFLIRLAVKNLYRYGRRTIITAVAIGFGLGMFIYMDSMLLGMERESENNLIWYETSSARILADGYLEEKDSLPLKYNIENYEEISDLLTENGITNAPRLTFGGEIILQPEDQTADKRVFSSQAKIIGIKPGEDAQVFRLKKDIAVGGSYLEPGDLNGALVGILLAEKLGIEVGDTVTLLAVSRIKSYVPMYVTVRGLIESPNPYVTKSSVFIDLGRAQLDMAMDGRVTEINTKLPYSEIKNEVARMNELLSQYNNIEAYSWKEIAGDYVALAEAKSQGASSILSLVVIIAAVGIINTMLMAVYERIRELGMMRALGMSSRQIAVSFMLEAAGIGVFGGIIASVIGFIMTFYMVNVGIDFSFLIEDMNIGYRSAGHMYGAWNPTAFLLAFVFGIILTTLIAIFPTRKALKMEITDCIHHT